MNRNILLYTLLFIFSLNFNNFVNANYYVIDGQYEDNSVIKLWFTTLGLLDAYDKNEHAGFEINFDHNGKHFTANCGPNWWSYYFAFNKIGTCDHQKTMRIPRYKRSMIRFETVCTMLPERANFLLNKYMHLQPSIKAKLAQLKTKYFSQGLPLVGVYYQNPIMPEVQAAWSTHDLCARVKQEIQNSPTGKVCLLTSLDGFAEVFEQEFTTQLICITELANDSNTTPAERGKHELLTLLLMAQCDMVIAPGSYQAIGAKMLNPDLKLIELDTIPYARE